MHTYASLPSPSTPLKGAPQLWLSLGLLGAALVVAVPIYSGWLAGSAAAAYRFGLAVLWGGLALLAVRSERLTAVGAALFGLFGVSLGFVLAYLVGSRPLGWLGLSWTTPQGAAVAKLLSEAIPVSAAILAAAPLAHLSLESLGLRGGRVRLSLGLALLSSIPLVALFLVDPQGGGKATLATSAATLLAWLPWVVAFSLGNGFMEELWFRGAWLGAFTRAVGASAAMHVTSVAFCVMHVIVYWSDPVTVAILAPVWLYMGYAYAAIVRKTNSLWGPVLGHAIADLLFMFAVYATGRSF